ncbi:MAG: hypothetical protein HQK55_06030 [Deltaproteobacteria bacterium]|nr:hypothetical protein [Deltaproteobacteria bacterium]
MDINDNPTYKSEFLKLQSVRAELTAADQEIDRILSDLVALENRPSPVKVAALAYLDSETIGEPTDFLEIRNELAELRRRRTILREAMEIQKRRLLEAEHAASRAICEKVRPEGKAIYKKLAAAVKTLNDCLAEEKTFFEKLRDGGIQFASNLPRIQVRIHGGDDYRDGIERIETELKRDWGIIL